MMIGFFEDGWSSFVIGKIVESMGGNVEIRVGGGEDEDEDIDVDDVVVVIIS